jgi:hypothetical protein
MTAWTPTVDLPDASISGAPGPRSAAGRPWSATRALQVLVDGPPAPPTGLQAVAGDARVSLVWFASPDDDVTGYRVCRSTTAGGPYTPVATVATLGYDDLGLTNGVTYYYVVKAMTRAPRASPERGGGPSRIAQALVGGSGMPVG